MVRRDYMKGQVLNLLSAAMTLPRYGTKGNGFCGCLDATAVEVASVDEIAHEGSPQPATPSLGRALSRVGHPYELAASLNETPGFQGLLGLMLLLQSACLHTTSRRCPR